MAYEFINRAKASVKKYRDNCIGNDVNSTTDTLESCIDIIELLVAKLSTTNCGDGWIYCGDGNNLPETAGWYIASYELTNGNMVAHERYFNGNDWLDENEGKDFYEKPTIVAWQNMPTPYKEGEK